MLEKEAIEKGIDVKALKAEQKKLSKSILLKDAFDFKLANRFTGITTVILEKSHEILASAVLLDENLEIIEEKYTIKPIKFPYIPGYRAYRELPAMIKAYKKLEEQPDVIFVEGHGIAHPRGLGLASHFGLAIAKPTIGIAKTALVGEKKNNKIVLNNKTIAQCLVTKKGSKLIFVSTGHMISLKTAVEITKKCVKEPHKLPEPLIQARKYTAKTKKELQK